MFTRLTKTTFTLLIINNSFIKALFSEISHKYDINQRKVVTEVIRKHVIYFREIHESYQGSGIWKKQDHIYAYDPRTRKGKLLEHCFFCLRAIQELIENKITDLLLENDYKEWYEFNANIIDNEIILK